MPDNFPYDSSIIEEVLPHRSPFLFVDRIIELEAGKKITAEKDLSPDSLIFVGHFPGTPIMPGVLVSEALAQTSGLLLGLTWKGKWGQIANQERSNFLLLAHVNMKFFNPAKPGETLRLDARFKKKYGRLYLFDVAAHVLGSQIAKGTLTLAEGTE
jgi:3-hydroxyacyl-[acyl-carrier-protein] dehydratase